MARVVLARSARRQVLELPDPLADAVLEALALLEREPETGHQLRGRLTGLWSMRVGVYRIIYELRERGRTVRVCAIRHRGIAYHKNPR